MATAWSDPSASGSPITARSIEELRAAIRTEIVGRRKLGTFSPVDASVQAGMSIKAAHTQELIDQLGKVAPQGISVAPGDLIRADTLSLLRANMNMYENAPAYGAGESGCNAGCTGVCTSCTGTCTGTCTGCTNCSGCSGCGSGCDGGCTSCSIFCTSCTGNCSGGCSSCSNTCTGTCKYYCHGGCQNGNAYIT